MSNPETPNDTPAAESVETAGTETIVTPDANASGADGDGAATGDDVGNADATGGADDGAAADDSVGGDAVDPATPYEGLNAPEGFTLDADTMAAATPLMRGLGIADGEAAQAFIDKSAPLIQGILERANAAAADAAETNRAELVKTWATELRADKEFGGAAYDRNLTLAATARDTFFSPETNEFLTVTGLANNPAFIKDVIKIGRQLEQGDIHRGEGGQQTLSPAQKLYGEAFQPRA